MTKLGNPGDKQPPRAPWWAWCIGLTALGALCFGAGQTAGLIAALIN